MKIKTVYKKEYDFVFIGATTLAVSAAQKLQSLGHSCLIYDSVGMLGHEFSYALCTGNVVIDQNLENIEENTLLTQLKERSAINADGGIHLPAITPILSLILLGSGVEFFPYTVASELAKTADGWSLTLCSGGQRTNIETKYVIDTTAEFFTGHFFSLKANIKHCTLNAAICPPEGYIGEGFEFEKHQIKRACFDSEYYAKFSFGSNIYKAKEKLVKYIMSKPKEIEGWRIISVAEELDIKTDAGLFQIDDKFLRCSFTDNAVEAYDRGINLASQIIKDNLPQNKNIVSKSVIPLVKTEKYDVIVAGLGTAGAIAAITAAREGLRVLGLEQLNSLGGMGTVGAISTRYLGSKGGLYEEINKTAKELCENGFVSERDEGSVTKSIALDMAAKAEHVDVRLGATVTDVLFSPTDKKRITGLYWIESDGMHCALSDYVVDSTADGLVCLMAGCEMENGRVIDNGRQLYSNVSCIFNCENKTRGARNQDEGTVNQYNPSELGKATIKSCTSPLHLPKKFQDSKLQRLGPAMWIGIREGARIVGEESVTLPDMHNCKITNEPVFYEYSNLDNHGKDTFFEGRVFRDWVEICSLWDCRIAFPVPLGALIPKGFYGIVVAGRCLSVDHEIAFAVRMKDAMQKSGEAVARALALAIKNTVDVRHIKYEELRQQLKLSGVIGKTDTHRADYYQTECDKAYKEDIYILAENPQKVYQMLSTNNGGAAVMAAASKIDKYLPMLKKWILEDGYIALNSAFALCIGGHTEGVEDVISKAILDRSGEQPRNSHTFNYPYAVSAMSAAGRGHIAFAIDSLLAVVSNPHYAVDIPLRNWFDGKTVLAADNDDIKYLYFTAAIVALYEICETHPEQKQRVSEILKDINLDEYQTSISMIGQTENIRLSSRYLIENLIEKIKN